MNNLENLPRNDQIHIMKILFYYEIFLDIEKSLRRIRIDILKFLGHQLFPYKISFIYTIASFTLTFSSGQERSLLTLWFLYQIPIIYNFTKKLIITKTLKSFRHLLLFFPKRMVFSISQTIFSRSLVYLETNVLIEDEAFL